MGALLVGLAAAGILMSAALPVWTQAARREREAELVFRGEQYARAVQLYQRTYAGAFPPDVETLLDERFLRRRYRDPMVADGEFRIVRAADLDDLLGGTPATERPGQLAEPPPAGATAAQATPAPAAASARSSEENGGGVSGVVSRSSEASLRVYNGATRYDQWVFVPTETTDAPGRPPAPDLDATDRRPGATDRSPR